MNDLNQRMQGLSATELRMVLSILAAKHEEDVLRVLGTVRKVMEPGSNA